MGDCTACANVFRALGDKNRLQIVRYLREAKQEVCVNELLAAVAVAQPTLAHHMKILAEAHLVKVRREGRCVFYTIDCAEFRRVGECLSTITES